VTRPLAAAPLALLAFVAALGLAAAAVRTGFVSDDAVRLWAGALTAGEGDVAIGRIVAAYPTIPFWIASLVSFVAPAGTPAPALVAAALFALIAGVWFLSFRTAGLPTAAAVLATLLLAFHPALLRAETNGPADMFLAAFLFMLGGALYDLRARGATSDVMAVGLALLGLAFSHPMGAAIALAAVPFLAFAVRPALIANSALNIVIALVFPTLFAVGAFTYVSWVFPGAGWTFFAAPAERLSTWRAGVAHVFGDGITGIVALDASLAMGAALALGAPLVLVALAWVSRRRRPLVAPALVFAAAMIAAAALTVATGLFGDPTALAVAVPVLAAVVMTRVPMVRTRLAPVMALLATGWLGGVASLALVDPAVTVHLRATIAGGERERTDALAAGGAATARDGVLADTENAPALVLGRGRARGMFGPASEPFALALIFSRLDSPFVAVPDPQSASGANDRLNKAFPALYRRGAPGYRLIYQNITWRLYERLLNAASHKE
jgi:membrane protein XagC